MKNVSTFIIVLILGLTWLTSSNIAIMPTNSITSSTTVVSWQMFHHDPQHTGYSTSTIPPTVSSLWNFTTYGPGAVSSSPAVTDGKIFVGSDDNNVYALDQNTGQAIWIKTTLGAVHSSPAFADGRVFVGSNDGYLYALNSTAPGATLWSRKLVTGQVYASPTVVGGLVYVTATQTSGPYAYVYSINATTGDIKNSWCIVAGGYTYGVSIHSSPAVVGDLVFFGAHSQYSYANYASRVFAWNATNGSNKWQSTVLGGGNGIYLYSSPAVVPGSAVYIGNDDGYLYALDYNTGALQWKVATGGPIRSSPATGYGKVFVGSNDKQVHAFTLGGAKVWNYTTGGTVRSSPAVADGKVVVGSDDGYLYVLDATTGALIWKYFIGAQGIESSPAVADGLIFVGSLGGKVHAFGGGVRVSTKIQFSLSPNPAIVGQTVTLKGNLTTATNSPISGASVVVKSGGTPVATLTTNSTGWFKASGQITSAGTYTVTVEYAGSPQYLPSSATKTLTVNKAQTEIFAKFTPNPVGPSQPCTLKGILLDELNSPIALATITLEYSTDYGLTWNHAGTMNTNTKGIFSKAITAPQIGIYLYRMNYTGSSKYASTTTNIPLIIR